MNPTTKKSTKLEYTSNFSTQVAQEAPISDHGYSNIVPEWLTDHRIEVDIVNTHHDPHYKPDPEGALIAEIEHANTTAHPPDPIAPRSLPNQTTAVHEWDTNCS